MTYEKAGVSIKAGDRFAAMIAARALSLGITTDIGGFAGSFPIPAGTTTCCGSVDGDGTKLILLLLAGMERIAGMDAAAMAGVDMYVAGCQPTAAFDYFVTDHLDPERHVEIVDGVLCGCQRLGCQFLPGGETAEHPGIGLPRGYVDIAVFVVGIPDPDLPATPQQDIKPGMEVWGWLSGGPGANGYSLIRQVLKLQEGFWARVLRATFGGEYGRFSLIKRRLRRHYPELGCALQEALLGHTRIYVKDIERIRKGGVQFVGHAHITGDGMPGNIPRILPERCTVRIDRSRWQVPPVFKLIQRRGRVTDEEMFKVFNMGIQMVSITPQGVAVDGPNCVHIGRVHTRRGDEPQVIFV